MEAINIHPDIYLHIIIHHFLLLIYMETTTSVKFTVSLFSTKLYETARFPGAEEISVRALTFAFYRNIRVRSYILGKIDCWRIHFSVIEMN